MTDMNYLALMVGYLWLVAAFVIAMPWLLPWYLPPKVSDVWEGTLPLPSTSAINCRHPFTPDDNPSSSIQHSPNPQGHEPETVG